MRSIDMRGLLLAAVGAGSAMGCPSPAAPVPEAANDVDAEATKPVNATKPPEATKPAEPMRPAEATKPASSCPADAPAKTYCLAPFTQPAAMVPPDMMPKLPFDKQGCLARENLNDACGGVREVLSGPRLEKGKCCFTVCQGMAMPCGRPFLDVDARPRFATSVAREDWQRSITVEPSAIADRLRKEWLADAAAEHASVAAFARFTMELLAVGAPSSLVEQSQRAGQDEIEHARVCYAIASAYGARVGPGRLSLAGIALREDLAEIAAAAVVEGCLGETYAAMSASEARASCTDPAIRRVLERIADDEARHAALAWQFVAWALASDPTVRDAVEHAFRSAPPPMESDPRSEDATALREAGRLDASDRMRVWRTTRDEIVAPCLRTLLG